MKLEHLKQYIANLGSLAVGFSGGVDSSLLTAVAHEVLGDRLIAVTGADASVPEREVNEAAAFCKERGIRHIICRVDPSDVTFVPEMVLDLQSSCRDGRYCSSQPAWKH